MPVFSDRKTGPRSGQHSFMTEWVLLGCGLSLLGLFMVFSLHGEWKEIERREGARLLAQTQIVSDNIERQLATIQRVLKHLKEHYPGWLEHPAGGEQASRRLGAFAEAMQGVRTFLILDREGTVYASSRMLTHAGENFSSQAYFQRPKSRPDLKTLYVSPPFKPRLGNAWVMSVTQMIPGPRGEFAGIVMAALEPAEFETLLGSVRYAKDMWVSLAYGDATLFLTVPQKPDQVGTKQDAPGSFFTRHRESGQGASVLKGALPGTGENGLIAQRTLQVKALGMDAPLIVAAGRSLPALYADWRKKAWSLGAVFFLLMAVSVAGLHSVQGHRRKARKAAEEAANALAKSNDMLQTTNIALKERSREAEAASRAKSAFMANMSHEIRTPMNAVLGFLALLQRTTLTERQHDYVQKGQMAGWALLGILDDILDFSKGEAGKITVQHLPFRTHELFRSLSVLLATALDNKKVELIFRIDPQLPSVLNGDALRLQQILLNLASNAIKFTEQGEVVLSVDVIHSEAQHTKVQFSIQDTGIGIPEDRLKAIFEGFTQAESSTTRRYGGTGLGLAISQRLVEAMGGALQLESQVGVGSHFYFSLVFEHDNVPRTLEEEALITCESVLPKTVLRLLLAEDHPVARTTLFEMCASFGWEAVMAGTRDEALAQLAQAQAENRPFDLLCIDWMLPGLDGWDTVQHLRHAQSDSGPPVILMVTTQEKAKLADRMENEGRPRDGFLVKPITPSMLLDAVAQACEGQWLRAGHEKAVSSPVLAHPLSGLSFLLVEDNVLNQYVAQELLSHAGARVQVAHNGREGVRAVLQASTPFDGILMDLQMPEMDGFEATRRLRAQGVTTPIIAMTANAMSSDKAACFEAGMDAHIAKPIDVAHMISTLSEFCLGHPHEGGGLPMSEAENQDKKAFVALSAPANPRTPAATAAALPALASPSSPHARPGRPDLAELAAVGLDLEGALARLGGQESLFATLAQQFVIEQEGICERIQGLLEQDEHTAAVRELHTLKGLSGTFGAKTVQAAAARAEAALKNGASFADITEEWAALEKALSASLPLLARLAHALEEPPTPPPLVCLPFDPVRVKALLEELRTLFAARNMRALDVHAQLKAETADWEGGHRQALDEAVQHLDFEAANTALTPLLETLTS